MLVLASAAWAQADAERELAEKYNPVVRLVEQEEECGYGEPYDPIDIDLILANNEVLFRGPWDRTNVVKVAPGEADLDETRVDYHLDFPGDALEPECEFEKLHRRTIGDSGPTVYGRVITEEGKPAAEATVRKPRRPRLPRPRPRPRRKSLRTAKSRARRKPRARALPRTSQPAAAGATRSRPQARRPRSARTSTARRSRSRRSRCRSRTAAVRCRPLPSC